MKKLVLIIFIISGFLSILTNIVNDFENYKAFYASFYPNEYYEKDLFLVTYESSPSSGGPNKTNYIYSGYCKSDKLKYSLGIPASIVDGENFLEYRISNKIPIWRISNAKKVIFYRNKYNRIYSPFSYNMRDYWIGAILSLLFFPSLIYYLYLRTKN